MLAKGLLMMNGIVIFLILVAVLSVLLMVLVYASRWNDHHEKELQA